jgi:hypothetical protein
MMLAHVEGSELQAHRLVPLAQVTADSEAASSYAGDLDLELTVDPGAWPLELARLVVAVLSRRYTPRVVAAGNTDFQFTRGLLGVST